MNRISLIFLAMVFACSSKSDVDVLTALYITSFVNESLENVREPSLKLDSLLEAKLESDNFAVSLSKDHQAGLINYSLKIILDSIKSTKKLIVLDTIVASSGKELAKPIFKVLSEYEYFLENIKLNSEEDTVVYLSKYHQNLEAKLISISGTLRAINQDYSKQFDFSLRPKAWTY